MQKISLGRHNNKHVQLSFDGQEISTDGGLILINKINNQLKLTDKLANNINDVRDKSMIKHDVEDMLKQRVYSLASGYEDLNDHTQVRKDSLFKLLFNKSDNLASPSTLCRFENSVNPTIKYQEILVEAFINSYKSAPKSITLDFDPTDVTLYGNQEFKKYHGYYQDYCYLPLIVTCNEHILVAYLRTSANDNAKHVLGVLKLLVTRIKQSWPDVDITFRADSGLCRDRTLKWCEKKSIKYIVGIPGNNVLNNNTQDIVTSLATAYQSNPTNQKVYTEFTYQAKSWTNHRKVIAKIEYNHHGSNTRYIVTNKPGSSCDLYKDDYSQRGDMENRIKELQGDLFGDRLSCSRYKSNQFRMLLSAIAYTLMLRLKQIMKDTTTPYCKTVRIKLIKVAVIIRSNTRKIYLQINQNFPYIALFKRAITELGFG